MKKTYFSNGQQTDNAQQAQVAIATNTNGHFEATALKPFSSAKDLEGPTKMLTEWVEKRQNMAIPFTPASRVSITQSGKSLSIEAPGSSIDETQTNQIYNGWQKWVEANTNKQTPAPNRSQGNGQSQGNGNGQSQGNGNGQSQGNQGQSQGNGNGQSQGNQSQSQGNGNGQSQGNQGNQGQSQGNGNGQSQGQPQREKLYFERTNREQWERDCAVNPELARLLGEDFVPKS